MGCCVPTMPTVDTSEKVRCPISWWVPGAIGPEDVVGCGSTDVTAPDDEGLVNCNDCGIFFWPEV